MTSASATARQAVFAPIEGGDRVEAVMDRLAGALALGLIADGEQLPGESQLAASLGVATVTLREALSGLRTLGVIATKRGRGGGSFANAPKGLNEARLRKRLQGLGAHELRDIGDLHIAVGGRTAHRAAQRTAEDQIRRLDDLIRALESATTAADRRRADGRFHIELAAAAQSPRLTTLELTIQSQHGDLLWVRSSEDPKATQAFHRSVVQQHRAVLAAVRSGEAEQARQNMESHIGDGLERLLDLHFLLAEER